SPPCPLHVHSLSLRGALPILVRHLSQRDPAESGCRRSAQEGVGGIMTAIWRRFAGLTRILTLAVVIALVVAVALTFVRKGDHKTDRKSTRLNSSHVSISYAVF